MENIFKRCSIRKYQDKKVEAEKIELILKAAMAAPSACNQQPWQFYVVENKEIRNALSTTSPYAKFIKDAPVVFVPCFKKEVMAPEYCDIDMSACVENMLLAMTSLDLGGTWCGISPILERMEKVKEVLQIPEELHVFALVSCGYPNEDKIQQDRYDKNRIHYIK